MKLFGKNKVEGGGASGGDQPAMPVEWDNMAAVAEEQARQQDVERQRRKLIKSLLYGPDQMRAADTTVSIDEEQRALADIREGRIGLPQELGLLRRLVSPLEQKGAAGVLAEVNQNPRSNYILSTLMLNDPRQERLTPKAVEDFYQRYELPVDFEGDSERFLEYIKKDGEAVHEAFVETMAKFKQQMYGKRQEYWERMRELNDEASEERGAKLGGRAVRAGEYDVGGAVPEIGERKESLVLGFGVAEKAKYREGVAPDYTEDAHLEMSEQGLFAVFDGAGGTRNVRGAARVAARTGVEKLRTLATDYAISADSELAWALDEVSKTIERDPNAGLSTGVAGKIVEEDGMKKLKYATVGDSRIYVVRGNVATQITRDEGEGRVIRNALGLMNGAPSEGRTKQFGTVELLPGDKIVLCSDGVTGDVGDELMSDEEVAKYVDMAENEEQAAQNLVGAARKNDDRAAIVVRV